MTRQPVRCIALGACVGAGALAVVLAMPLATDHDDTDSDDSHTRHNTRCDPGYPEGVCVQSPVQSENNTTSAG